MEKYHGCTDFSNEGNMQEKYIYWLMHVPGLGSKGIAQLLSVPGGAEAVYRMERNTLLSLGISLKQSVKEAILAHRKEFQMGKEYEQFLEKNIRMTWLGNPSYPERLKYIPDPPAVLFYKGRLPTENRVQVAVVGARECSEYGSFMARELGTQLAKAGMVLVSGMARGIDGIGQMAACKNGGTSIGVLGCGVDICYPRQNQDLYDRLAEEGCVLSEYLPGTQPVSKYFPARNRIISGLSDVLVVVEAREKSGTFITVDMALEQGKDVYVVPGRLTDPLSRGCNRLIHQGAEVLVSVEEFVEGLGAKVDRTTEIESGKCTCMVPAFLTEREARVYEILDTNAMHFEVILQKLQNISAAGRWQEEPWEMQELMWILLNLCIKGVAKQVGTNSYVKVILC